MTSLGLPKRESARGAKAPRTTWVFYLVVVGLALAFPLVAPSVRALHTGVLVGIYAILIYGMSFLFKSGGLLSVAHGTLWGIGAYTAALLAIHYDLPFVPCMLAAMAVAAFAALAVGYPSLRVRGHYFLIVTFAFAEIMRVIATNWIELTNGDTGLAVVKSVHIGPFEITERIEWYYLTLVAVIAAMVIAWALEASKFGRRLIALRENEQLAKAIGINPTRDKLAGFVISGLFAGAAGCFWAFYQHYVTPYQVGSHTGIELILMLLLGGVHERLGPLCGVIIVITLPGLLGFSPVENEIALGAIFIAVVMLMPGGIVATLRKAVRHLSGKLRGRHAS